MAFRFFRRFKVAPGVHVNLSKSGPSLSVGPRGAKMTVGPRGTRTTVGVPGTGLHYTKHHPRGERAARGRSAGAAPPQARPTSQEQLALLEGCRAQMEGNLEGALDWFRASGLPDAAWLSGCLLLSRGRAAEAVAPLEAALARGGILGDDLEAIGAQVAMGLDITPEYGLELPAGIESAELALVEALQATGRAVEAIRLLQRRLAQEPSRPLTTLSFVELAWDTWKHDTRALEEIVRSTNGFENDSAVHAAVLLYRSRALRELGQSAPAREVIMGATRRTKDRPQALLLALRYERALVHELLGERAAAAGQLQRIHGHDAGYLDVAERLSRLG